MHTLNPIEGFDLPLLAYPEVCEFLWVRLSSGIFVPSKYGRLIPGNNYPSQSNLCTYNVRRASGALIVDCAFIELHSSRQT